MEKQKIHSAQIYSGNLEIFIGGCVYIAYKAQKIPARLILYKKFPFSAADMLTYIFSPWRDGRTSRGQHSQVDEVRIWYIGILSLKKKSLNKDSQSKVTSLRDELTKSRDILVYSENKTGHSQGQLGFSKSSVSFEN